jgi:small subunit ribosomal protein S6
LRLDKKSSILDRCAGKLSPAQQKEAKINYKPVSFRCPAVQDGQRQQTQGKEFQMRQYELILIVQPELDEETTNGVVDRVKTMITQNGGEILNEEVWGSKALAYEINDFREGFYVYMDVAFMPEFGTELKQSLRYIEPIIRYMLTKKDN